MTDVKLKKTIRGTPVPKPRMSQRDKWKQRPCVVEYRAWADLLRRSVPKIPIPGCWTGYAVSMQFFLPKPKRLRYSAQPHDVKPDLDNLTKGVLDALFRLDQMVVEQHAWKHWDDGHGPRLELEIGRA